MSESLDFYPGRTLWLVVPHGVETDDAIDAETWLMGRSMEVEP